MMLLGAFPFLAGEPSFLSLLGNERGVGGMDCCVVCGVIRRPLGILKKYQIIKPYYLNQISILKPSEIVGIEKGPHLPGRTLIGFYGLPRRF